jgi:hypothetical protein
MASFTNEQIESALVSKSQRLDQYDIRRIAEAKDAVLKMIQEFPDNWAKAQRQATLLFNMIEDAANGKFAAQPDELKFAAGALIYLGDPLDLVPDEDEDGYSAAAAMVALAT